MKITKHIEKSEEVTTIFKAKRFVAENHNGSKTWSIHYNSNLFISSLFVGLNEIDELIELLKFVKANAK